MQEKREWVEATARLVMRAALLGGWQVRRCIRASTGTVYVRMRHPRRGRLYVRISDHRSKAFQQDRRVKWSVRAAAPGGVVELVAWMLSHVWQIASWAGLPEGASGRVGVWGRGPQPDGIAGGWHRAKR